MRAYTIAFSVVAHLLVAAGVSIAPLFATIELPEPRRAVEFIEVTATLLRKPPPERRVPRSQEPSVSRDAAPVVAPDRIADEPPIEPSDPGSNSSDTGVPGGMPSGDPGGVLTAEPVAPPAPAPPPAPLRVGGAIKPPQKVRDVSPIYPTLALAARREGIVILEAVIGEDGRVRNLRVLRSIPLLDQAAVDAVRQWQFTPTLLNGEPVAVVMTVTVTFQLEGTPKSQLPTPKQILHVDFAVFS